MITDEKKILEKIKELTRMSYELPDKVYPGEEETWSWYCKGGISALRWILEVMNTTPAVLDLN